MNNNDMPCSLEEFSATVEIIYDSVIYPDRWRDAVKMICELSDSPYGSIGVFDLASSDNIKLYDYGYSPEYWYEYQQYAEEHPIMPAVQLMQVGEVTTIALACGDEAFFSSRVYREFFEPRGQCDFIGLMALRTGSRIGYLHTCRDFVQPRYDNDQIRIFNLLSKHICRAMQISDLFDLQAMQIAALEQTLNGLSAGVFLCDDQGKVVYMNHAAENQLSNSGVFRMNKQHLSPVDRRIAQQFTSAFSDAMNDEADINPHPHSIALPNNNGSGLVATILPLGKGDRKNLSKPFSASAAVFVQDPAVLPLFPGEAFAKLYGLTGGELRVALAMDPEHKLEDVAEMLGIGLQTVKTHLQHIFQKTGTSRQAELVALMSRASVPVKAGS